MSETESLALQGQALWNYLRAVESLGLNPALFQEGRILHDGSCAELPPGHLANYFIVADARQDARQGEQARSYSYSADYSADRSSHYSAGSSAANPPTNPQAASLPANSLSHAGIDYLFAPERRKITEAVLREEPIIGRVHFRIPGNEVSPDSKVPPDNKASQADEVPLPEAGYLKAEFLQEACERLNRLPRLIAETEFPEIYRSKSPPLTSYFTPTSSFPFMPSVSYSSPAGTIEQLHSAAQRTMNIRRKPLSILNTSFLHSLHQDIISLQRRLGTFTASELEPWGNYELKQPDDEKSERESAGRGERESTGRGERESARREEGWEFGQQLNQRLFVVRFRIANEYLYIIGRNATTGERKEAKIPEVLPTAQSTAQDGGTSQKEASGSAALSSIIIQLHSSRAKQQQYRFSQHTYSTPNLQPTAKSEPSGYLANLEILSCLLKQECISIDAAVGAEHLSRLEDGALQRYGNEISSSQPELAQRLLSRQVGPLERYSLLSELAAGGNLGFDVGLWKALQDGVRGRSYLESLPPEHRLHFIKPLVEPKLVDELLAFMGKRRTEDSGAVSDALRVPGRGITPEVGA